MSRNPIQPPTLPNNPYSVPYSFFMRDHHFVTLLFLGLFLCVTSCDRNTALTSQTHTEPTPSSEKHGQSPTSDIKNNTDALPPSDSKPSASDSPQNSSLQGIRVVESVIENTLPSFMTPRDVVAVEQLILSGSVTPDEQKAVMLAFDQFKSAVLAYDAEAVQLLSDDSIEYYKNMLDLARVAVFSPQHYERIKTKLPYGLKTNIELLKQRISPEFIEHATPQKLYQVAFEQGWIGYRSFQTASLDNLQAYDRSGQRYLTGDFIYDKSTKDKFVLRLGFVPTPQGIKIDLTPLFVGIEQAIEQMIQSGEMDAESSFIETVSQAQQNLEQTHWPVYENKTYAFAVQFPKPPTEQTLDSKTVFTSIDHRYGQFSVIIDPCGNACPTGNDKLEKQYISKAVRELQGTHPDCRQAMVGQNHVVFCKFDVPQHDAVMMEATIFSKDRVLKAFNQAPAHRFDLDVAQTFLNSFRY